MACFEYIYAFNVCIKKVFSSPFVASSAQFPLNLYVATLSKFASTVHFDSVLE